VTKLFSKNTFVRYVYFGKICIKYAFIATSAGVVAQKRYITPCNPTAGTVTKGVI
jgi:hypothetical protein